MWAVCSRVMVKVGLAKPHGLVNPCHLVKPVSATRVTGRYLTHQSGLPCLPVPPLQQTCDRYITALEPIMEVDELKHTRELMEEFQKPGGVGERLQKGLEKRASNTKNWLSEWWVQVAYLDYRMPVVIHSSPGLVLPRMDYSDKQGQIRFAAKLIAGVLDFKTMIDNETLPVEYLGGKPLCMNQYYEVLSSCRIPGLKRDTVVNHAKSSPPPKHITVVHNFQFIVGEDGMCGANYEHAPAEGPPIVALIDHVVEYTRKPETAQSPKVPLPMPQKLHFNITPEIKKDIEEAKHSMNKLAQDLDMRVMVFSHFGKNLPKAHKISPDAFIQMALQLAYYRMYQRCCSTYESASLRMFRLGRTDTIRSASSASAAFVKAFDDHSRQNTEKVDLMGKAIKAHKSYTNMAISGQAIDRHLLGLKMQAVEDKISVPDIFKDSAYNKALHYHLSTSQVPSKTDCVMCFGPVVPNGYGVCYNPMNDHINFAVSSFNGCKETNGALLAQALEDALLDMRTLLEQTPRAKL
ncbi:carnitine O-acetyltransferase isoform X3 [Mastacembelus armatus]|uniref:carnitine O-acetyltransferase isoform X3 n=1 Tax=Mastacembelus armatus TaxID=205130 RepID=UPI000E45F6F1|nr:carnitine O-acetyltransferase-like isoform X3 [Mastacembelus armatus]